MPPVLPSVAPHAVKPVALAFLDDSDEPEFASADTPIPVAGEFALGASEDFIGSVGGSTPRVTASMARPADATQYALGEPDEDGAPTVIGEEPGYRLNILPELLVPELEAFRVTPPEPMRIWAGDEPVWSTVFLLFADEAEAREVLADYWIEET